MSFERQVNQFKPDATAIAEAPVPVSTNLALYGVLLLLGVAILWSVIGTVDRIVVGQGRIMTRDPVLVMQPFTTSRIQSIDVKAGDRVTRGQVLARFDPSFAEADVTATRERVVSLSAQIARLEAQLSGRPFQASASDSPERLAQAQIYAQEMNDYQAEISQRQSRLAQIDSVIRTNQQALPGLRNQLNMANQVVDMQTRLQRQRAAATLDVLRAENGAIDARLRMQETLGDNQKLSQQRAETVHGGRAYAEKWRSERTQQLVAARRELSDAQQVLNKASRMQDFTQMRAPVDGIVQEVADRSIGSTLREAETLMTIVPDGAALYVEANVASRDISYLGLGDAVRVKLESFPFQRFGTIEGVVSEISPDSLPLDPNGRSGEMVYRVQVQISDAAQALAARRIILRPGLVATAEIKTGTQTIASYILDPVLKISDESLREP